MRRPDPEASTRNSPLHRIRRNNSIGSVDPVGRLRQPDSGWERPGRGEIGDDPPPRQGAVMECMVLIYRDETEAPEYGSPEWEQMMSGFLAFNQRLIDGGHWIAGGGLQTTPSATTVRLATG
jgi:hypothetical protein